MKKKRSDYLWIASLLYLFLGLFHILFAWLGLICFLVPLLLAVGKGEKSYCNHYCGRGQLMQRLGNRFSAQRACPGWLRSRWFRYGFLLFFLSMFASMLYMSYAVLQGKPLSASITLLWTVRIPWFVKSGAQDWILQFAYGFYSLMLTSTMLGILTMLVYKPRTWCVYCPMGTMTQMACRGKKRKF